MIYSGAMKEQLMQGKNCLISGPTSGIGRATALALAGMGARLILLGRTPAKLAEVAAEVEAAGGQSRILLCDLNSLTDVRRAAQEYLGCGEDLHVLINNAGLVNQTRLLSADGIEQTLAVNYLAPFLLTNLLLPALENSGRIISVSSEAHRFSGGLDLDDLEFQRRRYSGFKAYNHSKLALILFTRALAPRLESATVNVLDPGPVNTNLGLQNDSVASQILSVVYRLFFRPPAVGAQTSIYLASSPEVVGISGRYFTRCREKEPARHATDPAVMERLWQISAQMTDIRRSADR